MMYKVEAIIREEKLEDIKEALHEIDVNGVTAYQVMGFGAQRGYKTVVRGQEIDVMLLPKIKLEIVVSSEEWKDKTIQKIKEVAYTGEVGDGKIFAYELISKKQLPAKTGSCFFDLLDSSGLSEPLRK